jgi:hypothetical protein
MLKWSGLVLDEGNEEAMARLLRKQDDAFCETLRRAVEAGREVCPIGVITEPSTKRPILNYVRPD